jgi:outer membrane biosynthesis protein TonB
VALPSRRAAKRRTEERRGPGRGLRPGVVFSALLHLSLAALVIVASLQREKPPEPLPPPSYAMEFERGAPDRPAEEESNPPPSVAEAPPQDAVPQEAPAPEAPLAEVEPPAPEPAWTPREAQTRPPPQPEAPLTAEATPPRPEDLPIPPPPAPPQPQRDAALTSPPRPLPARRRPNGCRASSCRRRAPSSRRRPALRVLAPASTCRPVGCSSRGATRRTPRRW